MSKNVMKKEIPQAPDWEEEMMAEAIGRDLLIYLAPLLMQLEEVLDKRVVRTFAQTILAMVRNRDRARCLVQTELGGLLLGVTKAKAGAKRLRTRLEQTDLEERLDRSMADGGSRAGPQAVGSARSDADSRLGWQCAGKTRKRGGGRTVPRAFQ